MSEREPSGRDGFLRRWSRLKSDREPADPALPEENAVRPPNDAAPPQREEAEPDDDAVADLPDIETLDKDSDYTVFLRDGVPEALRRQALRKLWLSDPVLANLDGLNDYDDDFAAILRKGADYMEHLVESGKRLTRPGAEDEAPKEESAVTDAANDAPEPSDDSAESPETEEAKPRRPA